MRPTTIAMTALVALALPLRGGAEETWATGTADPLFQERYIVVLEEAAIRGEGHSLFDGPTVQEVAASMRLAHGFELRHTYEHTLPGFAVTASSALARRLAALEQLVRFYWP